MAAKKKVADTEAVRAALCKRFSAPAWAVLEEVGNATGFRTKRHIDMVAVSLWPSRGLELHGIEIKASRQDVLRELRNPEKAEAIQVYCHRWWLAVAANNLIADGELPPTWGLLVLRGGKMVCSKEAPKLKPKALDMPFVAALLRRAAENEDRIKRAARSRGFEEGKAARPDDVKNDLRAMQRELDGYKEAVRAFEEKSGIQIGMWDRYRMGRVGEIVKRIELARGSRHHLAQRPLGIEEIVRTAEAQIEALENAARRLREHVQTELEERALVLEASKEPEDDE